jgi:tRNA uridine 5-carboxymethylaminomethyl modification enzyme
MASLDRARARMGALKLTPNEAQKHGIAIRLDGVRRSALELLSLPDVEFAVLAGIWPELDALAGNLREQIQIDAQYAGYLGRQEADILAFRRDEALRLPDGLDYAAVRGLSTEARLKLSKIRPETLGQAARIDGMTPAALTLVLAHVRRVA